MTVNIRAATVTGVTPSRVSKRVVCVAFDDGSRLVVPARAAEQAGAAPGVTMLAGAVASLREAEGNAATQRAVRRLARADRTEREIRADLSACQFSDGAIETAVEVLRTQGLLNDTRSAEHYVSARTRSQPRSRRALQMELAGRGIDPSTADAATAEVDDEDGAMLLAERRAARAPRESFGAFAEWLGPYLRRRGYDYETIERVTRRAWESVDAP